MKALQSGQKVYRNMTIFEAINASVANIEQTLKHMKLPINQPPHAQETLEKDLKAYLENLYTNVKKAVKAGNIVDDPTGILNNEFILATTASAQKSYPHHVLLPVLIKQIIDADKEPLMPRQTARQKAAAAKAIKEATVIEQPTVSEIVDTVTTAQEPNASTVEGLSELDTNTAEVIIPEHTQEKLAEQMTNQTQAPNQVHIEPVVQTQVNAVAAAVADHTVASATETVAIPVDINHAFHIPYMTKIEGILLAMNDALDAEELQPLRTQLTHEVRLWTDAFYKSLHDLENPNRVTVDRIGLLTATTKYSQPEMHAKYDNAHLVDKIIAKVSEKYKKTNNTESSVHAMATAISGAQDETKSEFTVPTNTDEEVHVDKTNGDITGKKGGKIVEFFKGMYKGVQKFFKNLFNQLKRFGAWIKSWFTGGDKDKVVVSPEEAKVMEEAAKVMEEAAKARATALAQAA